MEKLKSRKFFVLILMTVVNVLYIGACGFFKYLTDLMPLIMALDGVYAAYMGVNVWQKVAKK